MMTRGKASWRACLLAAVLMAPGFSPAAEFSASFKGTDIEEFINTVGKNLSKTIIIEPSVRGKINVRSYDLLNDEQYYQFFLSVLDVYGFAVVPMDNGVLKVVRAKDAKTSAIPVVDDGKPGIGDEMVTRVVPVRNVSVRELAPLLRQLNDNAGGGNVVHYEPSNVLLITGRAAVVNRLVDIVRRVDKVGDQDVDIVKLKYASATEIVRLVTTLTKEDGKNSVSSVLTPKVVADERTNSVVVSGEPKSRQRVLQLVRQLDRDQETQGNTRVFYLKYAKAKDLAAVLGGVSKSVESEKQQSKGTTSAKSNLSIDADEQTNSLVITAEPDVMGELEKVIAKLDIRRAQVLVEAIIVEVQDGDALSLGVQWVNRYGGGVQFTDTGLPASSVVQGALDYQNDGELSSDVLETLSSFNGLATGFYSGNWGALLTALSSNTQSNLLATPSIVTLDNKEATINIGQEVPVVTGSQSSSTGSVYSTVERKTVGTKLKVTPQINEGDSVLLEIEQEVSSVADSTSTSSDDLGSTFNTRTISNAVLVKSGQTVVLGGLLSDSTTETVSKVPLLGDIPLLGNLFRSTSNSKSKQNLMVFIRPTILRDPASYDSISSTKYNLFRAQQLSNKASESSLFPTMDKTILPEYGGDNLSPSASDGSQQ
ncbi:type II secretion system secretin GspD [Pseudaeromonas sp. ZJS20]|uniref:type II secretion system secretin GspD n=1 Tax=Pseudaeromonas aegiceratis TaxID=3153928 RepID=UPI00390C9F71